jgi:hypothetical protein
LKSKVVFETSSLDVRTCWVAEGLIGHPLSAVSRLTWEESHWMAGCRRRKKRRAASDRIRFWATKMDAWETLFFVAEVGWLIGEVENNNF